MTTTPALIAFFLAGLLMFCSPYIMTFAIVAAVEFGIAKHRPADARAPSASLFAKVLSYVGQAVMATVIIVGLVFHALGNTL